MVTWATKYRPTTFDEMVANNSFSPHSLTVKEFSKQHLLLHSKAAGVGKTTYAHVIANHFGYPLHIFNASSKKTRGIAFVEEELLPLTRSGNYNQYILLDEADQLTPEAQGALKGVIENAQGLFILTCNNIEKVSPYLRSRCMTLEFKPIEIDKMLERLRHIAVCESVSITSGELRMICEAHNGDLRNAINALQAYDSLGREKGKVFLHSLTVKEFDSKTLLTLCFREKDFTNAMKLFGNNDVKQTIRSVFDYAVESDASSNGKMTVIDAAITAERDLMSGIDEDIVKGNFLRMLIQPHSL